MRLMCFSRLECFLSHTHTHVVHVLRQAPVGFWDPAGFTADGDAKDFYRRRVVEIKHGRVAMLACTGYIVQELPWLVRESNECVVCDC